MRLARSASVARPSMSAVNNNFNPCTISATITATSVYTANLHRSLRVFLATITAASIYTTVSITASIEASITATSVYTANLHRSLRVFAATITAASIYTPQRWRRVSRWRRRLGGGDRGCDGGGCAGLHNRFCHFLGPFSAP